LISARGAAPWCSTCEWNLDRYEPHRRAPELGWRWLDRHTHRAAFRANARTFTALVGGPVGHPGWSWARVVLLIAAVLLLTAVDNTTSLLTEWLSEDQTK
jgi:hypothetical protein